MPSAATFLIGFGLGGKELPTLDAILSSWEGWLASHTSYPSLVVAGAVIAIYWAGDAIVQWRSIGRVRKWRGNLIELMKEGVALRNEGADAIQTQQAALDWIVRAEDWRKRVFNEIKRFDANAAEDYELLDVVPEPRIALTAANADHFREYGWHDFRVLKLRALIKDTQQRQQ